MKSIPHPSSKKLAGIYGIIHTSTSRIYVGSAINITARWKDHFCKLQRNTHENRYLQQTWNKYGPDAFEWVILEEITDLTQLILTEQTWINYHQAHKRDKGFNINPTAGSPFGRKLTEEQKKQRSINQKTMNRKQTEYQKQCVSNALQGNKHGAGKHYCGHLTEQNVKQILEQCANNDKFSDIARDFKVSTATINRISLRRIWASVKVSNDIEQALLARIDRRKLLGEQNRFAKLKDVDIPVIRERLNMGETCTSIAKSYNVTIALISQIKLGKAWAHIPLTELEGTSTVR